MWAMIPMLRVRARGTSRMRGPPLVLTSFSVTAIGLSLSFFASYVGGAGAHFGAFTPGGPAGIRTGPVSRRGGMSPSASPPVVGERLVGLGHLLQVVLALD